MIVSRFKLSATLYFINLFLFKQNKNKLIKYEVAESLISKSKNEFWSEIRKIKSIKSNCSSVVDNVTGSENISNLFKNKYDPLYNEFNQYTVDNVQLTELISDKCMKNVCMYDHSIDTEQIINAVKKLKNNKIDPVYGISSCNIVNGSDVLYNYLGVIFSLLFNHGISSVNLNKSILVPIPKNKRKSICDSSNYRAIALSSIVGKLFEYIILRKIQDNVQLNSNQFGYKKGVSTAHCSFALNETIQYYKSNGSNFYALFLDASKAFDRVRHDILFRCLFELNVCPLVIRLIAKMYELGNAIVKWERSESSIFKLSNGVRQGAILSPFLFSIYLNPLLNNINSSRMGCHTGNIASNVFAYADDIVILSPTVSGLKSLIQIINKYSLDYSVDFNAEKSFIIVYSKFDNIPDINIKMNNSKIEVVKEVKHLGFYVNNNRNMYDFDNIIHDMKTKSNVLRSNFSILDFKSKVRLFKSHCLHLYGCEMWNIEDNNINSLVKAWRRCIKCLLNLDMRTRSKLLPSIIESKDIITLICNRQLNFYIKGINNPNSLINFYFKNAFLSMSSFSITNLNNIMTMYNLPYSTLFVNRKVTLVNKTDDNEKWRINIIKELCNFKDFNNFSVLSYNEINAILKFVCTY